MIKIFTKRSVSKRTLLLVLCLYLGVGAYAQTPAVKGVVKDAKETIVGATITAQNVQTGAKATTSSDKNGVFTFARLAAGSYKFTISFMGYESKTIPGEVKNGGTFSLSVVLKESSTSLDKEVVITGTGINRKKDSFTGTTAVFSAADLKGVGNNNIIQSLRTLDPSFLLIENTSAGSNPNVLPTIEVRGKSSIPGTTLKDQFAQDPNQPLFILDGFPTTLQTISDLDMNRISSVTILKDAASTALYGAQASNGVIVIETVKPVPGELRFSYVQDFRYEMPDLSGYNMMNAAEKLEFERLSGRYTTDESSPGQVVFLDELYNKHLASVRRGVDSYWLSEPIQNGYSTNSSINASGGDNAFTYNIGMNYRTGAGAMKGSGRDSYSGSVNLTYRTKKFNINNITYIRGNSSTNSPYGSFSTFVNANPYYEKNYDQRYLEVSRKTNGTELLVTNPLFDAVQPQYDKTAGLEVQNNLNLNYDISNSFRLNGGLQVTKGNNSTKKYQSTEMSDFLNTPILRKGKYTDYRGDNFSYQANAMLVYHTVLAEKHIVNANWRNSVSQDQNSAYQTIAEGFPVGNLGNPRFAYSYQESGAPAANSKLYRTLNTTISANYSYDNKYLADVVYRLDGSTAYGSNKQFSPYYAFGLGWNIHNEAFVKNVGWINSLRLTGNIGITGNQNYGNTSSVSVYNYNTNTNYNQFGQGVTLSTLGNPNLSPQTTRQISTSIDFSFFNNRLSGYINAYDKKTDPLIVPVDLPSSTGVVAFPYNIGSLTYKGLETKLTFMPIRDLARQITWSIGLTGSSYKSKYDGFGNILNTLNKQQENNKTLLRYADGNSAEAIWAIKSMGIDPATGREVFLTKDGQYTFDYNTGNIINVGNTVPTVEGVVSSNIRYKQFSLGLSFRYKLGGDIFNYALFNKVENITLSGTALNQDKRALYDRWRNPGDIAQFKGISQTETTPISSRFVQKENSFTTESVNFGYFLENAAWLKTLGLRNLSLNLYSNDLLYLSTVRRERGTDYPFTRTLAFSLKASF